MQRLIWNFEFIAAKKIPPKYFKAKEHEQLKWEARYFWPADNIIQLAAIDISLLDIANYQQKHREDEYYLLPDCDFNIKKRRDELLYKPLIEHSKQVYGFGAKINLLDEHPNNLELLANVKSNGLRVLVKKEAFIYKFNTKPTVKLELSRIELCDDVYFSLCLEGKSRELVKGLSGLILGKAISCNYVSFLKNVLYHV
ncbi:MAG: hypothetical protein ACRC0B_07515 [Legionella sp.]